MVHDAELRPVVGGVAAELGIDQAADAVLHRQDVVEDLEGQVTRMLEFIGIPFEEECISFYKTDRSVRTASSEQVRKPVNKDGMERWKPYAKYLKPLLNVLDEDLLKPEDVAYINK